MVFHALHGYEYKIGELTVYDQELPSPIGGATIPARITFLALETDDPKVISFRQTQRHDSDAMEILLRKTLLESRAIRESELAAMGKPIAETTFRWDIYLPTRHRAVVTRA